MFYVQQRVLREILDKASGNKDLTGFLDGIGYAGALLDHLLWKFPEAGTSGDRVVTRGNPRLRQLRAMVRPKQTSGNSAPVSTQLRRALIYLIRASSRDALKDHELRDPHPRLLYWPDYDAFLGW